MAITINWATKVISVPQADLTPLGGSAYQMDLDAFRLTLKDLEDDEAGMPFVRTHNHNAPVSLGGVTLARVVEIINGYTVTFGDGQYSVNLIGANSNVGDVVNLNQVSVRSANSAGLTAPVTAADLWDLASGIEASLTPRQALRLVTSALAGKLSGAPSGPILIRNVGDTKDRINATVDANGNRTAVTVDST